MPHAFLRHTALAWVLVCSGFIVATASCGSDQPSGPGVDVLSDSLATADSIRIADSLRVADSLAADTLTVPAPVAPDTGSLPPIDVPRSGIPFGEFHLPASSFKHPYTGALLPLRRASDVADRLKPARAAGIRVVIALAVAKNLSATKGKFDLAKWKKAVDRFRGANLDPYIADGTIVGHYIIDEPDCKPCWGGVGISEATINEMARYSKAIWPTMATGVRMIPSWFTDGRQKDFDFGWAQWEGPLHLHSFGDTPEEFRDREIAAAKKHGIGVVFGLNYINGGDGSSGILGTYRNARKVKRFAMSAAEVKRVGAVFARAPYACAVVSWRNDDKFLGRAGMKEALAYIADVARNRPIKSCKP